MVKVIFSISLIVVSIATSLLYHVTHKADIEYYKGRRYFDRSDYAKAIPHYENAIKIEPSHLKAVRDSAYIYQWTGNYDKAVPAFRKILLLKPSDNDIRLDLARTLSWQKNYPEAISLLEQVVSATGSQDTILDLGEVYQWSGQFEKSRQILESLPPLKLKSPRAGILYARALFNCGDSDMAMEIVRNFYESPDLKADSKLRGEVEDLIREILISRKDYIGAMDSYRARLAADSSDIRSRVMLADILSWVKRYDESVNEYKEALRISPGDISVMRKLARVYSWKRDYSGAEILLKEILKERPKDTESRIILADILSYQMRYDEAIKEYEKILKREPKYILAKRALAEVYVWSKDYGRARVLYDDLLKEYPDDMSLRVSSGELLIFQKKYDEAIIYFKDLGAAKDDAEVRLMYGKALLYSGDYNECRAVFNEILERYPDDKEASILLADSYAYDKQFKAAAAMYRAILNKAYDREVKRKLADVLSWDKQYTEALKYYDELITEEKDDRIRLQKARVLGWARDYTKSIYEYGRLVSDSGNALFKLEMDAKAAYWNSRIQEAIVKYGSLVSASADNVEAMFDLAQIYSYEGMWKEAIGEYENILKEAPGHFRARDGLEKALLIGRHLSWEPVYEFYEADSPSRDMDIRRNSIINKFSLPVNNYIRADGAYIFTARSFGDFPDVVENEGRLKLSYIFNPTAWFDGYYNMIAYNRDISAIHTFGASAHARIVDAVTGHFLYKRDRLENTSSVIREHYYSDDFKWRLDADIDKRLKCGVDYFYSSYSDNNERWEPGFDVLYYFSLDPLRLTAQYRYFYRQFENKDPAYFSPKGFTTNIVSVNWRHYLNKEEIFFGADDLYYEAAYQFSVDSTTIVGHQFTGAVHWDVNKRLSFDTNGGFVISSNNVYRGTIARASLKYYF